MKKLLSIILVATLILTGLTLFVACGDDDDNGSGNDSGVNELLGQGATFPRPLYDEMFLKYKEVTGIRVNYSGVGSSKGIAGLMDKVVDFGGTDAFISDEKLAQTDAKILHIPTCIGAIAVAFNVEGVDELKLTGDVIAKIFMGEIKKWDNSEITALNPGASLPNENILVMHRAEGSGTTYNFAAYLSMVNNEWKNKMGAKKEIDWPESPAFIGAKGNDGVTAQIKGTQNSIGYIEIGYAIQNDLPVATVQNKSGNWIEPSLESASYAAQGAIPDDTRVLIANTDAPKGYPICTFTWIIFYQEQKYDGRTKARAEELVKLLKWIITDGQSLNETLHYAKLPKTAVDKAMKIIDSITFDGKSL